MHFDISSLAVVLILAFWALALWARIRTGNHRMSLNANLDMTAFDPFFKQYYTDDKVQEETYADHPWLTEVPKDEEFYGANLPIPLIYGNPQGVTSSLATAISNQTSTKGVKYLLTRFKDYGVATIDHETLRASEKDAGAFLEAATTEIDGALRQVGRLLSIGTYGSGTGSLAQIDPASTVASATLTLNPTSAVVYFEVGQTIGASATDGGTARVGTAVVSGVDRVAGTITTAGGNWSTQITSLATGDYLFIQGTQNARFPGLAGWIPSPVGGGARTISSAPFFGVDRTSDVTRLAGVYFDGTGVPLEEVAIELLTRIEREGGSPDIGLCNHAQFRALAKAMGARVVYNDPGENEKGVVGFRGLAVAGTKGSITLVPDRDCPNNNIYFLTKKTWKLRSLGKAPTLFETDSLKWLRGSTTDDLQLRIYSYAALACNAPAFNGVAYVDSQP